MKATCLLMRCLKTTARLLAFMFPSLCSSCPTYTQQTPVLHPPSLSWNRCPAFSLAKSPIHRGGGQGWLHFLTLAKLLTVCSNSKANPTRTAKLLLAKYVLWAVGRKHGQAVTTALPGPLLWLTVHGTLLLQFDYNENGLCFVGSLESANCLHIWNVSQGTKKK